MRSLRIGYWPLSEDLKSAGDRRRVVFWANARGHTLVRDLSQKVDVIIASENSDFNSRVFSSQKTPLIFDLVDAYLSPSNYINDLARGIAKNFLGQISGAIQPFSHHVKNFCIRANAVICSSIEQESIIREFNSNTHVILDSHDEIPFNQVLNSKYSQILENRILWEGQPATIPGVKTISQVLSSLSKSNSLAFEFVTDEKYFNLLNKYLKRDTLKLLEKDFYQIPASISLTKWTLDNLINASKRSKIAIIPIDISIPMQKLKPENRLLIMWRLGLPCLTSASPAYVRVSNTAGVVAACENEDEWYSNFSRLLHDPGFANQEILLAQNYLFETHTTPLLLKKWDEALKSVLDRS